MQKHKLHLQILDYTAVNNHGMFQTNLHLWLSALLAFQEPDELLVPVYAGCKIVSVKAHFSLFQTDKCRLKSTKNTLLRLRFYA